MQTLDTADDLLNGFAFADDVAVQEKMRRFAEAGPDKLHLLFDFDRTMTVSTSGNDDATTWHILQRHLPPDGQRVYQQMFQKYRQLEIDGKMTPGDARIWWRGTLELYVYHRVNLNEAMADFLSVVVLRPGTEELLRYCSSLGIPAAILSAGIKEVIELLLEHYGAQADPIISTRLITDAQGVITGWQDDTLIHTLNKHEADNPELERIRAARPYCILIGDNMDDADMAAGNDDVLRIRVIDPRKGEVFDKEAQLAATFQKFDLAITTGTLDCVTKLLQAVAK